MIITITPEDAARAHCYVENGSCLLATAVKRSLDLPDDTYLSCGPESLTVGDDKYIISKMGAHKIWRCYGKNDKEVQRAVSPKVRKPFKVKLTKEP